MPVCQAKSDRGVDRAVKAFCPCVAPLAASIDSRRTRRSHALEVLPRGDHADSVSAFRKRPPGWLGHWSTRYGEVLGRSLNLAPPFMLAQNELLSAIPQPMREALDSVASDAEPMDRDGRLVAWRLMRSAMLDLFGPVGVTIGALVLSATAFNLAIQRLDLPPFLASKQEKQVPPSQKQPRRQDEQIPSNQQTQEPIPQTDKVRKDSGSPGRPSPQPRGLQRRSSRLNLPCLVEHRLATLHLAQDVIA